MTLAFRFIFLLTLLLPIEAHAGQDLQSHFPQTGVPQFLFDHLDIATFRSSLGPQRDIDQRRFAGLSPPPTTLTANAIEILEDNWLRRMTIVDRGDFNRDGIEDLVVCLEDNAIGATYRSTQLLLITRYSDNSAAIALHFSVDTPKAREGCQGAAQPG